MPSTLVSARTAGAMYLAIIGLGLFGEAYVRGSLVTGDAATTAGNILGSQLLWRIGTATDLVMHVLDVPLIVFFYLLLAASAVDSQALALLALDLHGHGFGIGLVFFGMTCLVRGVLIVRSGYVPRLLGALLVLAGFCYLIDSFALLLSPTLAALLFPAILLPPLPAELALALWLLFANEGVLRQRLSERASPKA